MAHYHDGSYRQLFSSPDVVRHLIADFVPHPWLDSLDFSTLEQISCRFVTDTGEVREADAMWRVKVDEDWLYLLILIEFQSTVDHDMAIRMMVYVGLCYQHLARSGKVARGKTYPPVLPIVLYNGERTWSATTSVSDRIGNMPEPFDRMLPKMDYLLIDINRFDPDALREMNNLVACIMLFERPVQKAELLATIEKLKPMLANNPELERIFAQWIPGIVSRRSEGKIQVPVEQDLSEMSTILARRFKEWEREATEVGLAKGIEQGIERGIGQGIEQGVQRGEALALRKLLTNRFGPISTDLASRIDAASLIEIDRWLERILRAETLDDVFRK